MFLAEKTTGRTWPLHPEKVYRLGRSPDQDIWLDEPSVSRSHAELFWHGGNWWVRDCNSRFGTFTPSFDSADSLQRLTSETSPLKAQTWFRLGHEPGVFLQLQADRSAHDNGALIQHSLPPAPPQAPFSLEDFRGQRRLKQALKQAADFVLDADLADPVQGVLLLGSDGRGKRFLGRCLADQLSQERQQTFTFISRDLSAAQTADQARKQVSKCLKEATKNTPTVLLLQNFDVFYQSLQKATQNSKQRTGQTTWWYRFWGRLGIVDLKSEAEKARKLKEKLNTDLETYWAWNLKPQKSQKRGQKKSRKRKRKGRKQAKILILIAASNPSVLPPDFLKEGRLFSRVLQVPRPDALGRQAVLEKYLHRTGTPLSVDLDLSFLSQRIGRIEGNQVEQLVKDAERHRYEAGKKALSWQDFAPFLPTSSAQLWRPIFIAERSLTRLKQLARVIREFDPSTSLGSALPKGLLLTGPPGTGKTAIARVFAKDAGCYFQAVAPSTIKSSLVGQGVKNLQALFDRARANAPAILFFDEIDALFPRRDEPSGDPTALEIVNQFLQEVDGFDPNTGVFVLGATNRPEEIDPAVRSRLQEQLAITLPEQAQRIEMLRHFIAPSPLETHATAVPSDPLAPPPRRLSAEVDLDYYAQLLIGKSGRGIEAIAKRIVTAAQRSSAHSSADPSAHSSGSLSTAAQHQPQTIIINDQPSPSEAPSPATSKALIVRREHFDQVLLPQPTGELSGVILPAQVKSDLMQTLQQFLKAFADPRITPPAGLLLSGPPGTGKTEIARAIARLGNLQFQAITASDVQDSLIGESERKLAKIFEQARHNAPTVLFFDEVDGLFPARTEGSAQHEIRLVNQFLQEVDGAKSTGRGVFILAASNRAQNVDAAIRSRLNRTLEIALPALPERVALLKLFVGTRPAALDLNWQALAKLLSGKSGRAIRACVEAAYHIACEESITKESATKESATKESSRRQPETEQMTLAHFQQAIVGTSGTAEAPDLVLSAALMQQVDQRVETLRNLTQALSLGLPIPRGLLLTGPSGTGKTQIARYLAAQSSLFLRDIKPSDVRSTYHGGSVKNLQTIFADARDRAPCILFFDEIDALFPRRGDETSQLETELINEFLQQVDGVGTASAGIFILGATNRGDAVDPAVSSRLQQVINVPLPGKRERQIILKRALQEKQWKLSKDVDLAAIDNLLRGKSGRDIQATFTRIGEAYVQRVGWQVKQVVLTHSDFERALLPPVEVDSSAWSDLILSPQLKDELQATVKRFLRFFRSPIPGITPPKGMVLSGPPGTGKTQVARVLSKAAGCRFMTLPIADMRSKFIGEAPRKLAQVFESARREAPVILFIDEIDALFPKREEAVQHEIELINQLLQELDGASGGAAGVFVVGATNFAERVDDAVRSRLNKTIDIQLPGTAEIAQMLRLFTQEMPVSPELDWPSVARLLRGKSGRDIRQLVSEVGQFAADQLAPDQLLTITTDHFHQVIQSKSPIGELTWADVILPPPTKQELQRLVKLVANYTRLPPGIRPPQGALLSGPPGTGKTQIARVVASVSGLNFKSCAPGDIRSKYVGQGSQNLADVFKQARQQGPTILFFDEIESLFPSRDAMGGSGADLENQNLVNQFLQEVDGVNVQASYVFVLGATNFAANVDAAVRSRLQREIAVPLPTSAERLALLKLKLHKDWHLAKDIDLITYAQALAGQSGRDLTTGVETAAQLAFDEWVEGNLVICDRHFRQAFSL